MQPFQTHGASKGRAGQDLGGRARRLGGPQRGRDPAAWSCGEWRRGQHLEVLYVRLHAVYSRVSTAIGNLGGNTCPHGQLNVQQRAGQATHPAQCVYLKLLAANVCSPTHESLIYYPCTDLCHLRRIAVHSSPLIPLVGLL